MVSPPDAKTKRLGDPRSHDCGWQVRFFSSGYRLE
jgi:hypothetical protein